jgi:tyrocidine synthetase-3
MKETLHESTAAAGPVLKAEASASVEPTVKWEKFTGIEPVEEKTYYPVSSAQKRVYFVQQMDLESIVYNIPILMVLEGEIQKERLENIFRKLIARHESLRTSFFMVDEQPVHRVHRIHRGNYRFRITNYIGPKNIEESVGDFVRPFDLSQAPLLRVSVKEIEKQKYLFMMDIHHITADGLSGILLLGDFLALYNGKELPPLRIQYKDFSEWQNRQRKSASRIRQQDYWLKQFAGEIPVLELPMDFARPAVQRFEGSTLSFKVGSKETAVLKQIALQEEVTLYMILFALYSIFLSKLSGQEDIVIGSPIAGRRHPDLENIIGMFVNTLALRSFPVGDRRVKELLEEVKTRTLSAFDNQDYQFEDLVERLGPHIKRDISRNPLFDVMFVVENVYAAEIEIPGLKLRSYQYKKQTAKFDLLLLGKESEGQLFFTFEYSTKLFRRETIERFGGFFKNVVSSVVEDVNKRTAEIEVIDEEEKHRLLVEFNDTEVEYPDRTIHELFEEQAEKAPDGAAVVGSWHDTDTLAVGKKEKIHITYGVLNETAGQLAHLLRGKGVRVDSIVGIMMERSLDMVIGILGILKAGGAYLPIDPDWPRGRIDYMLKDSGAKLLVTTNNLEAPDFPLLPAAGRRQPATSLAYVIYTSGTTGKPKGVLTSHYNVSRVVRNTNYIDITDNDRILQLSNYAFDGSVFDIYGALLNRAVLVMIEQADVLAVDRLSEVIKKEAVTIFFVTTALFNTLVDIDIGSLHGIRKVLFGGERVSPNHSFRALEYLGKGRIIHVYGPTETTVYATYFFIENVPEQAETIPIGKPVSNTTVCILDRYLKLMPIGVGGEVYIGGTGTARGYLNRPELTAEKFDQDLWDYRDYRDLKKNEKNYKQTLNQKFFGGSRGAILQKSPPGLLYKTGDLARWLPDGNIEFIGRIDHQVKIRGFRIEPGEIESRLLNHNRVKEAVVLARGERNGDRYLCAYVVSAARKALDGPEIKKYLSRDLPDYMIPSYIIILDKIPLTPNGKIDRASLPLPGGGAAVEHTGYTRPGSQLERKLVDVWLEILNIDREHLGIDTNFFEVGGHSLKAASLISKIHKAFDVKVPLTEIFIRPTIRELAGFLEASKRDKWFLIEPSELKEYYPLSSAQKRLYILQQMDLSSTAYNIPGFMILEGDLDPAKFADTFKRLIDRHESLRTSFEMVDAVPLQRIHEDAKFEIEYYSSAGGTENTKDSFLRPFDLSLAPLFRVGLIKKESNKHILMIDMHHIISDGTSVGMLVREFMVLYEGKSLPPARIQYKDFSEWQNSEKERETIKEQETYWLGEFAGEVPVLNLPLDYERPLFQGYSGNAITFQVGEARTQKLKALALKERASLYMVLLSLYNIFLSKLSGDEDIVVGSPAAGRKHGDLENMIGMFVNTLALRNYPRGEKPFREFLREVRDRALAAFENQDYPFEDLVEKVAVHRDVSRNPVFDVMFALQNIDISELKIPGLKLSPYKHEIAIAKFDMNWDCVESEEGLLFSVTYCKELYKAETIERFVNYFKKIVMSVVEDPQVKIAEIEIIPGEEKEQILHRFNDTRVEYSYSKRVHELFEEQAVMTPEKIALHGLMDAWKHGGGYITYHELNKRSDQLAHVLDEKGVLADSIVGIMVEPSIVIIIGILGILKAGGAYLPIDPNYPQERIEYMLKDSKSKILLTSSVNQFKEKEDLIDIIDISEELSFSTSTLTLSKGCSANLAYVVYTSGTTGRPKGVMVGHRNVVRLVKNTNYIEFRKNDRILQTGALEFDASTFEIWGSLLNGLTLVLAPGEKFLNPGTLKQDIRKYDISIMWLTSPLFNQLSGEDEGIFEGLKTLLVGGDVLSPMHINKVRRRFPGLIILNGYGPTENTTFSTVFSIDKEYEERIPIGPPIANSTAYIVDRWDKLVPVGVVGELWVGGDGVSRGYMNNPGLTAEKFIFVFYRSYRSYRSYIYRTGDLARWLPDGNIEFIGRIDHQVKIRGFRIEPGEIESRLLNHNRVKETVVLVREDRWGERYLCAYVVADAREGLDGPEIKKYLSRDLPDYMIPSYIIILDKMPLTPNGKVDHASLPLPEEGAAAQHSVYTGPRSQLERKLVDVWLEILNIDREHLGIDTNFFEVGGHSLKAASLISKIHKVFDVKVPLTEIFIRPTIRELASSLEESKRDKWFLIEPSELKEYYPLSSAQKRLYILQQMDLSSTAYNIPGFMTLEGDLDLVKFADTFKRLIERHESLRTSLEMADAVPVQRIHPDAQFEIEYYSATEGTENTEKRKPISNFIRSFDLSLAPLFRVGLIKKESNKHILMVDMHHIISDGTSVGVLVREFMVLYEGKSLPPARIQYKDFSEWQNSEKERETIKRQEVYWLEEFAGEVPVLNLPLDYERPLFQDYTGNAITFRLGEPHTQKLKALVLKERASLYMVLLSIYNVFLSKLSGDEDIVVGSPTAGRKHGDLENMIGMFVNTLSLRNYPGGEKPFREFLRDVRDRTLAAFENQDYPFEDLVEKVAVHRDVSRNPVFDVMFAVQNIDISELKIPGLKLSPYKHEIAIAKFDMSWDCVESEEGLLFSVTYCTKLFKAETIERFINYFKKIVTSVLEDPQVKIAAIEIITEEEKEQIVRRFNDSRVEYWYNKRVHELFEEQTAMTPKKIALHGCMDAWKHGGGYITYHELNKKSNQLAHMLKEKGVLADSIVGIMVEPSIEMIIGILGILKAGGAYLPLDPNYPQERIDYMLKDSGAKLLVTTNNLEAPDFPLLPATGHRQPATSLAYIIYTSGTTGRPKGVAVEHGNLTAYLNAFDNEFNLCPEDTVIQQAAFTFDAFVEELYPILLKGGKLVIPAREVVLDINVLIKYIAKHRVTMITCSPQLLNELNNITGIDGPGRLGITDNPGLLASIRIFISGGDRLKAEYIGNLPGSALVYNTYGPTETTVCATYYKCREEDHTSPPIGKPIAGYRVYIMGPGPHQLQPVGIPGELCIEGAGVARGYLNQPELTAEKFIEYRSYRSYRTYISYRTGDLGRWLPDGNIEFLGRIDRQVKIRGYRIELGEIEKRLSNHVNVKKAAAVVRNRGERREDYICAYIVPRSFVADRSPDLSELRDYLTSELPEYMIPSYFIPMDRIPLTPNGKIDPKALPEPGHTRAYLTTTYVEPGTEKEMIVADIWKEVLGIDKVGLNDNFFELGGNSLNIIQLSNRLKKAFGKDIPTVTLFRFPKINSFLDYLNRMGESEGNKKENGELTLHQKQRTEVVRKGKEMMRRSMQGKRRH